MAPPRSLAWRFVEWSWPAVVLLPLFGVWGCGRPPEPEPTVDAASPPEGPPPPVPATPPLSPGDRLPPLTAAGWVNGPPPSLGAPGVRLLLVDLWGHWCPYCRFGAPELVRLHQKFAGRQVAFVSLTDMGRRPVTAFVEQFAVPWPSGYGAPAETVVALGAGSGMSTPGYGVAPTVYLVGTDGRVRWTDNQGRFHHAASEAWGRELEAAIEAALAAP
jgi:thiol-disulfide isomerase/thioredoxin